MDTHTDPNNRPWACISPFALLVADRLATSDDDALAAAFRRMGLRPETGDGPSALQLHFGGLELRARRADPATLAGASPDAPDTTLISHPLPGDWRASCLSFTPPATGQDLDHGSARANVLREFFKAMVLLIDLFDATHLYWSAAQLWSDARQFREAVAEMLVSGMPPVLHLVAFRGARGHTGLVVRTQGLANFSGQELVATCPSNWTMPQITKRLARIALDMILNGAVARPRRYRGLELGEWMQLSPQRAKGEEAAPLDVTFHFDAA